MAGPECATYCVRVSPFSFPNRIGPSRSPSGPVAAPLSISPSSTERLHPKPEAWRQKAEAGSPAASERALLRYCPPPREDRLPKSERRRCSDAPGELLSELHRSPVLWDRRLQAQRNIFVHPRTLDPVEELLSRPLTAADRLHTATSPVGPSPPARPPSPA